MKLLPKLTRAIIVAWLCLTAPAFAASTGNLLAEREVRTNGSVLYLADNGVRNDGSDQSQTIVALIKLAQQRGIPVVSFRGINAAVGPMTLVDIRNLKLRGDGGRLHKLPKAGSNSLIFNLMSGCSNIEISGFADLDGGYGSSRGSTGSNPIILIGDQTPSGAVGARNDNIIIRNNSLRRGNWAAVVVYGRSGAGMRTPPLNQNILIARNVITDMGGSGVFVYKNAHTVRVNDNQISNVSGDGIVFDTRAATDTLSKAEPVRNIEALRNTVRSFGLKSQGVGILLKGAVQSGVVADNRIVDAPRHALGGLVNYGIMVNRDAGKRDAPSNVLLSGNSTSNLKGSAGSVAIFVGPGSKAITLRRNSLDGCSSHPLSLKAGVGEVQLQDNDTAPCRAAR